MIVNNTVDEDKFYNNANVYSSHLKWVPMGDQLEKFGEDGIKPLFEDILIAKLRPGQEIEMELMCEKGLERPMPNGHLYRPLTIDWCQISSSTRRY